jgi:copper chaperone CopZ
MLSKYKRMTHTYQITGMTCNNCTETVRQLLSAVPGVSGVEVDLEKQEASVSMARHVPTAALQQALSGTKYTIKEGNEAHEMEMSTDEEAVTWKTYLPVLLLFGYITLVTLLIEIIRGHFDMPQWMRHFMAGFFLSFSFFKLLDVPAFAVSYSTYDVVAKLWLGWGYIYPFIELALGIGFLIPGIALWVNAVTLVVMSLSIIGVIQSMMRKSKFQCACLGAVFKLPLGKITLFEDALMIVMSAGMLVMILF